MEIKLKEHTTPNGKTLLYTGTPDIKMLNELAEGPGDIWHSSFEQGYKNAFLDIVYFTATYWWYLNDFDNLKSCVSWRINPFAFAIRKEVWEQLGGFDADYDTIQVQALDFGYNALRNSGAIPLYCKGLFPEDTNNEVFVSTKERYFFYRKNFKADHSLYMLFRKGIWKTEEWKAFFEARKKFEFIKNRPVLTPRKLNPITGNPTVSYIIPTMYRQDYTLQLLNDLSKQSYLPSQVVVVDATPATERDESLYENTRFPFELIIKWQTTQGSCRARNEALDVCAGDYIVFGDDDIRIPPDFIENHIRLLQTYKAGACNGLDIRADHHLQDLDDLKTKLNNQEKSQYRVGVTTNFSNANSCVKRSFVNQLVGNDINYDGGYGEDADFGLSLTKIGVPVLFNPFSANLHLKPPSGGYRWWGAQSRILGRKRKPQPWELNEPVKWVRPMPSPTMMYLFYKHYKTPQIKEYKYKYFFLYLFKRNKWTLPLRILNIPFKLIQFKKSQFYAQKLMHLGVRHE